MRISKLWPGFAIAVTIVATACGGGGGSTTTPAVITTATPASTPTPTPSPGPLQLAYTSSFGATSAATAAPAPIAFQAETQTATLTATQANYTGSFTATLTGCGTNVAVSPATSTTGQFTVTATTPVASGCSISIQGATGTTAVSVGATVPAPGGVQLAWVSNAALATQASPITPLPGPINLIGTTSLFGAVLVVSESAYVSTFATPTLSAGCGTNISALAATTAGPIAGPPTGVTQARAYYTVVAPSTATNIPSTSNCSITVKDTQPTPSSASIGITLTTTGGGIN